jgi:hypothetical protein
MEICAWCQPIRNERQTVEVRVQENVRARHCHRSVYAQKHTAQARFRPPSQSAASSNKSESNLNKAKKKITHPFPASIRTDTWARPAASRRNSASYLGDENKKQKTKTKKNKGLMSNCMSTKVKKKKTGSSPPHVRPVAPVADRDAHDAFIVRERCLCAIAGLCRLGLGLCVYIYMCE